MTEQIKPVVFVDPKELAAMKEHLPAKLYAKKTLGNFTITEPLYSAEAVQWLQDNVSQLKDALEWEEIAHHAERNKARAEENDNTSLREQVQQLQRENDAPIDMILYCPNCGEQHIDTPDPFDHEDDYISESGTSRERWTNPPHRSHLCHDCGHIWRPCDRATNGVREIKTKGKNDSPSVAPTLRAELAAASCCLAAAEKDAARYRLLRRKVCIIGGPAEFKFLNLPKPTCVAPDAAIELDAALDAARTAQAGEKQG